VIFVNREDAVVIFKEILNLSEDVGLKSFNLQLSGENDRTSEGYQIRIAIFSDNLIKQDIENLAKKHHLEVKEDTGEVIVYTPKS
jgi:cell division ATPase FtsA